MVKIGEHLSKLSQN